jgi:hypothetical protein
VDLAVRKSEHSVSADVSIVIAAITHLLQSSNRPDTRLS